MNNFVLFLQGTWLYLKNREVSTYFEGLLCALPNVISFTIPLESLELVIYFCFMLNALQTKVLNSQEFSHINLFQVQQQMFSLSGLRWFLAGATSGKGSCVSNKHFSFFLTTAKLNL